MASAGATSLSIPVEHEARMPVESAVDREIVQVRRLQLGDGVYNVASLNLQADVQFSAIVRRISVVDLMSGAIAQTIVHRDYGVLLMRHDIYGQFCGGTIALACTIWNLSLSLIESTHMRS